MRRFVAASPSCSKVRREHCSMWITEHSRSLPHPAPPPAASQRDSGFHRSMFTASLVFRRLTRPVSERVPSQPNVSIVMVNNFVHVETSTAQLQDVLGVV